ncbi:MAG TPA: hypothetical protein VGF10_10515 [Gaiella sp.]
MESKRHGSAGRVSLAASLVLVAGAVLVAVIMSGAATATSLAKPANTSQPTVTGTAVVGATLKGSQGTWSNAPTSFVVQWVRCGVDGGAPDGSNCASIPGASTTGYVVSSADVGSRLRFRVTASNADGQDTAASNATGVVSADPVNTSDPVVSGTAVEGQTLETTNGGWSSDSTISSFAYQWVRCGIDGGNASGSNCPAVSGATDSSYTLASGDVGHRLRVRVTAKNSSGSTTAASNPTGTVQPSPTGSGPARNTAEPSVSGTVQQGQTLTAGAGTWTGARPITFGYQWVRCGADGGKPDASDCATIAGATTTRYTLTAADVGQRLRVEVTGRNSQGSATAASNSTATVQGTGPALPAGATKLPNGKYSVPETSVSLPARLVIDRVRFAPNPVRSRRTTIELRVHVSDTRGYSVRDVLVFARSTPLVTSAGGEQRTGQDGWATTRLAPRRDFPLRRGYSVQFFVRARKDGDNVLAGVSTRRLVQVRTAR